MWGVLQAGVRVQVLMDAANVDKPYVRTRSIFNASGLAVPPKGSSQRTLSEADKQSLNLVPIDDTGLMHMKMRYFKWPDAATGKQQQALVSGSLNPEDTAQTNDDTIFSITDASPGGAATIARYLAAYNATLEVKAAAPLTNTFNPASPLTLLYSRATPSTDKEATNVLVRDVIVGLAQNATDAIFLSVYALRNLATHEGGTLVGALCEASQKRGLAVAVVTDKGQADGEAGFSAGDDTVTALRLRACGIPVFKGENYASTYSAFHHKNGLFGLPAGATQKTKQAWVVTDTANWSKASMGNGSSTRARPANAETTLVIESGANDGGVTAARFLSNFLQSLRKYSHQQHCPYYQQQKKGLATEHKNCAVDEPFSQPDWEEPAAAAIISGFAAKLTARQAWPQVAAAISVSGVPACATAVTATYGVVTTNATYNGTGVAPPAPQKTATLARTGGNGAWATPPAAPVTAPFGVSVAIMATATCPGGAQSGQTVTLVVDPAFDWATTTRQTDDAVRSMAATLALAF